MADYKIGHFTLILYFGINYDLASASPHTSHVSQHQIAVHSVYILEDQTEKIAKGLVHGGAAIKESNAAIAYWSKLSRFLKSRGAPAIDIHNNDVAVSELHAAVRRNANLRPAANNLTRTLIPVFATVGDRVPTYVHQFDYLGRQIVIDAERKQWKQVESDIGLLKRNWAYYKPVAAKVRGSERTIRLFDSAIWMARSGAHLHSVQKVRRSSQIIGNAVDLIENLYHR